MKKLSLLGAIWISVIVGFVGVSFSANTCTSSDMYCYQAGPVSNLNTIGRLDSSGNLTVAANETTTLKTIYVPSSQVNISTLVAISPTATNMVIESTGATVTFNQIGRVASEGPAISTSTATSGQILILQSTTTVSTVVITTGTATAVYGDQATYTISAAKNPVLFIYNATLAVWQAISYQ
jgi:hypothetical protein